MERDAFLAQPNIAVLATLKKDGRPHASPVWYLYEDGAFYLSVEAGCQKQRNIERDPRVSLVIDKRTEPYYAVIVEGTAEVQPPFSPERRLRWAARYLGEEAAREYVEARPPSGTMTIRITPRRVLEHGRREGELASWQKFGE